MASPFNRSPTVRLDGDAVRRLREERGLTQLYVAEVARVSVDTVSRWENKRTPAVRRENAEALAQALEVDLEQILEPETGPSEPARPRRRATLGAAAAAFLVLAGGLGWWWAAGRTPVVVEAARRLPPYTAPASRIPVVVHIRIVSGEAPRVILRETLPSGWILEGASPPPDQGPTPDGVVKWILPIEEGRAQVAYAVRTPTGAAEGSAFRFRGEVVTAGRRGSETPVKGEGRIDLEYVYWADEDADFQVSDAEVLDALERLEAAKGLGLDPSTLRRLWGAGEYAWDRAKGRFMPVR